MTALEMSSEFDILFNNISSNQGVGLNEFEKSVLLTKAQDEIIKNHYTNKQGGNKYQEGIGDSSKRFSDFSCLITVATINSQGNTNAIDKRGNIFSVPDDLMLTLNESFVVMNNSTEVARYQVVPITIVEYQRLMSKPSKDPLKNQVWKMMGNSQTGNGSIEIIGHYKDNVNTNNKLIIQYVRHPYPIILEDLSSQGLTINGKSTPYSGNGGAVCELAKELHPEILQRAVELAKITYLGQPADILNTGQRSE